MNCLGFPKKSAPQSAAATEKQRVSLRARRDQKRRRIAMEFAYRGARQNGDYKALEDFCGRPGTRIANKKMLESLMKAGFDFLGRDQARILAGVDEALADAAGTPPIVTAPLVRFRSSMTFRPGPEFRPRTVQPWSEKLQNFPTKKIARLLCKRPSAGCVCGGVCSEQYTHLSCPAEDLVDRSQVKVAGAIVQLGEEIYPETEGNRFAVIWLEDLTGTWRW